MCVCLFFSSSVVIAVTAAASDYGLCFCLYVLFLCIRGRIEKIAIVVDNVGSSYSPLEHLCVKVVCVAEILVIVEWEKLDWKQAKLTVKSVGEIITVKPTM